MVAFFSLKFVSLSFSRGCFYDSPLIWGGACLFVWLVKRIGRWGTGNTRQFLTSLLGDVV
jgi:hypothetical protein